jgi:bifunctional UDP-N-acetylglucosamine pyrophosphorylase / glucosamine-1-phosphate N-acetyltransferase
MSTTSNPEVSVVILAGGMGTRMRSRIPKVLHRAGGLPLIEHVVNTALKITTADRITVVVGSQADRVQAALSHRAVQFVYQAEQLGTGHAVSVCRESLVSRSGHVVIIYGDGPLLSAATIQSLIDKQRASDTAATLISTTLENPRGYGRLLLDDEGMVLDIVEEKAATEEQRRIRLVNPGIYCFRADLLWRHIGEIRTDNPAGEYYLTDMPAIFRRAGYRVGTFYAEDPTELLAVNNRVELVEVDSVMRQRKVRELLLGGVTIEQPETATIDASVTIGMDSIVAPFAQLLGSTQIGENCTIGACSIVQDSILADDVEIAPFTVVANSQIHRGARVGPFARLRMNNVVGESAHIGNFVELKNTRVGARISASHLAYLGDSEIGDDTNIGAGTITCNYDGTRKHPTRIGANAFVGSNSTLVAPVDIGEGSFIAAGSVVTDAVPSGALAIGRSRQVLKEGWAEKRRSAATKVK